MDVVHIISISPACMKAECCTHRGSCTHPQQHPHADGDYLEVQILRRRKKSAVHPMVIHRLRRLPRKLMPRMFTGFTRDRKEKHKMLGDPTGCSVSSMAQ